MVKVTHAYAKRTIAPGDHLLVYGEVERVDPTVVGLEPAAGYRDAETLPRVSAGARGMTVHVGDEATLCAGVRRERRALAMLGALAVVLASAAFALSIVWL